MKITVNNDVIPEGWIRREMQTWQKEHPGADDKTAFDHVSQRMIEWTLIRQQAEKQIVVTPSEVDQEFEATCKQHGGQEAFLQRFGLKPEAIDAVKQDMMRQRQTNVFLDGIASQGQSLDAVAVVNYFREHEKEFVSPEMVHVAHIVKHPQGEAAEIAAAAELTVIRQRLLSGENFLSVADETSECNDTAPDLGTFARGKMVPEFEVVVFSMNTGEISPVFKTPFGLHVATVLDRKEPSPLTFDEARPHIEQRLQNESRNEAIRAWVAAQQQRATIEVVPPA